MSDLEETLDKLERINPRKVREMSQEDMEKLHMKLMPSHHNSIVDLQESMINLKNEIRDNNKSINETFEEIADKLEKLEKGVETRRLKLEKMNEKLEQSKVHNRVLFIFLIIVIIICITQLVFSVSLHDYFYEIENKVDTIEAETISIEE